jgi:hypothetical protein
MPDEVLTIEEIAAPLRLAEKTVGAVAQAGELAALRDPGALAHQAHRAGPANRRAVAQSRWGT